MTQPELEAPPVFVECSPEQWAEAKASVARRQLTPFFAQGAGYRRSALRAALNSGYPIKPEIAVEFRSTIDAIGYRPRTINTAAHQLEEEQKRKAASDYYELLKKQRAEQPARFASTAQARAILGPYGFAHWFETPEGQLTQRLENMATEERFHGR